MNWLVDMISRVLVVEKSDLASLDLGFAREELQFNEHES